EAPLSDLVPGAELRGIDAPLAANPEENVDAHVILGECRARRVTLAPRDAAVLDPQQPEVRCRERVAESLFGDRDHRLGQRRARVMDRVVKEALPEARLI